MERERGLVRALERRDVDGGDPLAGGDQPIGDELGLTFAVGVERWGALPVAHREHRTVD